MVAGAIEAHRRADEPARRARPADHRGRRGRRVGRRGVVRARASCCAVRDAAAVRVRRDARPARGAVPVRPVRRPAPPDRVGSRRRHHRRPPRRAATRGDERWHDPRPRAVRRVHDRRGRSRPARRRARRGDGLRVAGRRRVRARGHELAHPGDHARPGARRPRVRRAGAAAVLEGRRDRAARRARRGDRRLHRRDRERVARGGRRTRPPAGLDERAASNLVAFIADQRAATRIVPDATNLVVERFRDELGDWRVVLHSPYGMRVHAPWALAVGARVHERFGVDANAVASDDGIVLRMPDTADEPPGAELFVFEPAELEELVTLRGRRLGPVRVAVPRVRRPGAAAAAAEPRAAVAALAAAPAGVAAARGRARLPRLPDRARDRARVPAGRLRPARARRASPSASARATVRLVEVTTETASPFASSLLFGYVGAFMYEGDTPLAERRAAALSLDPALLAELLGTVELRELLDPEVVAQTESSCSASCPIARLAAKRGSPTCSAASARSPSTRWPRAPTRRRRPQPPLAALVDARRVALVRFAGTAWFAAVEDASRLRDALGVPLPPGLPEVFGEPVADPLADLVSRYARTHGPFTATAVAAAVRHRPGRSPPPRSAGSPASAASSRASSCRTGRAANGATPRCSGACADVRSRPSATRSNRSRRATTRGSCPRGSTSAGDCAASTASPR